MKKQGNIKNQEDPTGTGNMTPLPIAKYGIAVYVKTAHFVCVCYKDKKTAKLTHKTNGISQK